MQMTTLCKWNQTETARCKPLLAVHIARRANAAVRLADLVARGRLVVLVEARAQRAQHLAAHGSLVYQFNSLV